MAADTIQDIFIDPPLAIARLGGSSMPQDAYVWVTAPEPRAGDTTTIAPTWTLMVQQDATVVPILPTQVTLRDGPLIRPVAPYFEIWARVGKAGRSPSTWRDVPLTPALLAKHGADLSDLVLQIDAKNLKAARRTGNPDLGFGTYPPANLSADQHAPLSLLACSPGGVREPRFFAALLASVALPVEPALWPAGPGFGAGPSNLAASDLVALGLAPVLAVFCFVVSDLAVSELEASDLDLEVSGLAADFPASGLAALDFAASDLVALDLEVSDLEVSDLEAALETSDLEDSDLEVSDLDDLDLEASDLDLSDFDLSDFDVSDLAASGWVDV